MDQQLKKPEEIICITDAMVAAYSNEPVWNKKDIIKYMNEYAKQFMNITKCTNCKGSGIVLNTDCINCKGIGKLILLSINANT